MWMGPTRPMKMSEKANPALAARGEDPPEGAVLAPADTSPAN
jgi:hypothetical protein